MPPSPQNYENYVGFLEIPYFHRKSWKSRVFTKMHGFRNFPRFRVTPRQPYENLSENHTSRAPKSPRSPMSARNAHFHENNQIWVEMLHFHGNSPFWAPKCTCLVEWAACGPRGRARPAGSGTARTHARVRNHSHVAAPGWGRGGSSLAEGRAGKPRPRTRFLAARTHPRVCGELKM